VNGCGGRKWCGGGRVERVGKERKEGLAVARGGLDEVPLFRRYGNVARCDITEDVGGGVSTSRDSVTRTMVFE